MPAFDDAMAAFLKQHAETQQRVSRALLDVQEDLLNANLTEGSRSDREARDASGTFGIMGGSPGDEGTGTGPRQDE